MGLEHFLTSFLVHSAVVHVHDGGGGPGGGFNEQSRPLLTFDIPQTALVATLDTYDF
jgi:hypothetical protein